MARNQKYTRDEVKIVTPEFRGSFVKLRKADSYDGGEEKFSLMIVLPANDEFWDRLEEKMEMGLENRFNGTIPSKWKNPIHDGNDKVEDWGDEFKDTCYVVAKNEDRPNIVDEDGEPIMDLQEIYSGAWYKACVKPYGYDHPKSGKGVSIQLDNVMKVRDDEPFGGGRADAAEDFKDHIGKGGGKRRTRRDPDDEDEGGRTRSRRGRNEEGDEDEGRDAGRASRRENRTSRRSRRE